MKNNFIEENNKVTFQTLVPLNCLLRFFNLSAVDRKGKYVSARQSLFVNIIYTLIFGFISLVFLILKINRFEYIKKETSVKFASSFHLTYLIGYAEYIIDIFLVTKYGKACLLKYFEISQDIDSMLSMTYCCNIRKVIISTMLLFMALFFLSSIFDYVIYVIGYSWITPTLYSVDYIYAFLNSLTILDAISHFVQLEYRLKMMNDVLQEYYKSPIYYNDKIMPISKSAKVGERLESLRTVTMFNKDVGITMLNKCYLMLLEQAIFVNTMYGYRILLFYANLVINTITLANIAIRVAIGCMVVPYSNRILPTMASASRTFNFATLAIIPVYRCEQTYRQCEKILAAIDLILAHKNMSEEMTTSLKELRHLIITRPIKFHAANFFSLDYTLLVSLTSVTVTYIIITLQNVK